MIPLVDFLALFFFSVLHFARTFSPWTVYYSDYVLWNYTGLHLTTIRLLLPYSRLHLRFDWNQKLNLPFSRHTLSSASFELAAIYGDS